MECAAGWRSCRLNIYRVADGDPYLQFVASTSLDAYTDLTAEPGIAYRYAISAVTASGVRSFLTDYVYSGDRDGDGLGNEEEFQLATDPDNDDTDGDGFSDYMEVSRGGNPADKSSTPTSWLSVTLSGSGGAVNSSPSGIACTAPPSTGICGFDFPMNTAVTLFATPEQGSILQAWGGACASAGTRCSVSMDSAKAVTAVFATAANAVVGARRFDSVQAAYNDAGTGDHSVMRLLAGSLSGNFTAYKGVAVTMEGGYDSGFSAVTGMSSISGNFRIRAGTVRVRGISTGAQSSSDLQGDLNKDRLVDIHDFSILSDNYGKTDCGNIADLNGDCVVDGADTTIFTANYGKRI